MKSRAIFILPPYGSDAGIYLQPAWKVGRIPPLGLITLASYLTARGHEVKVLDTRALILSHKTGDYIPLILKEINDFKPDIIGINILTALFNEAQKIAREIKLKYPATPLIAGGVHPSIEPDLTLEQIPEIDAVCIGAGEEVCLELLEGNNQTAIPGLLWRGRRELYTARPAEMNIDKYPFPDYRLADSAYYTGFTLDNLNGWGYRGLGVLTSRSCPYSCKFCAADWSKPFRYHSTEYVVEMAEYLTSYDIDVVTFYDDTIAAVKNRLYDICRGFINKKIFYPHRNLRWFAALRANQIEPDILKLMKEAGCIGVSMGVESGSDKMLKVIDKKTTVEMNKKACAYVKEAGLSLSYSMMIGIPGETEKDMKETIAFLRDVPAQSAGIGSFRPLPGSPFYTEFVNDGTLDKRRTDWSNLGNFTVMPDRMFSAVSKDKFDEIFDRAQNAAYKQRRTAVHEDTLKYVPDFDTIISSNQIELSKGDGYQSSAHVSCSHFSLNTVKSSILPILLAVLPYKFRKALRGFTKAVLGKKT
jgi:anaerobic magnesium-protoporphyrin IX monomethyl ester cyclase